MKTLSLISHSVFVSVFALSTLVGCQKNSSSPKTSSAKSSAALLDCSEDTGYYGHWTATVEAGQGNKVTVTYAREKGPDGDGEKVDPVEAKGEKVHGECDIYDFGDGYLKTCDGKAAEFHLRSRDLNTEMQCG